MRFLSHLLRHHSGKLFLLTAVGIVAAAVLTVPWAQGQAETAWEMTLAWAGFAEESNESGTIYWCPMHPQIKRALGWTAGTHAKSRRRPPSRV